MNGWDRQLDALDPAASVVVEACAGSGKTWLLVARIVRLLMAGVAPGEILAISYTRKAAREIESRLRDRLRELAAQPDGWVRDLLGQIGVPQPDAAPTMARARELFEQVGQALTPITVSTFHGWFAGLLKAAPLTTGLMGFELTDSETRLRDEVWHMYAQRLGAAPNGGEAAAAIWLLERIGLAATRRLLYGFIDRRAEWHAYLADEATGFEAALERLRSDLGVNSVPAVAALFAEADTVAGLARYAALLECNGTKANLEHAAGIQAGIGSADDNDVRFDRLLPAFLKADGEARALKVSAAMEKRLGQDTMAELLDLHIRLGDRLRTVRRQRDDERVLQFHCHALQAADGFLHTFEQFKLQRQWLDYADLEWHTDRLLHDEASAAFLLARLDARYKHILIDEFQDTNPLQWRILRAWLEAYEGVEPAPRLFIVGDPKQSIYRFRRAEPRLFDSAKAMLAGDYGARLLANDLTRRNAPAVVAVVNNLFEDEALCSGFRPHTAIDAGLPGRVEVLPLCQAALGEAAAATAPSDGPLRNPLHQSAEEAEDVRRRCEARLLVDRLREIVGRWMVRDDGGERPARYSDIMILTRRRSALPEFEHALRSAGMPYLSVGRGGLLGTLEAADLTALLRFLFDAGARSRSGPCPARTHVRPLGRGADAAGRAGEASWRQRLNQAVGSGQATPAMARAAGLLGGWLEAAARLPVHDLLDRIYHEGEVPGRYRAAVSPAMWAGVEANLEAFIALALEIDAGRYPSLPRFIAELDRLGQAADEDAPDEGTVRAVDASDGHIRILTVHGAKGLEAPIVWLIDAHNTHRMPDVWRVLLDWPPGADAPAHFSFYARKGERGAARDALFDAEEQAAAREEMNLLYVVATRAKQYLFASGVEALRRTNGTSAYERLKAAIEAAGGADGVYGAPPRQAPPEPREAPAQSAVVPNEHVGASGPIGIRREPQELAQVYGIALHRLLEILAGSPDAALPARPAALSPQQWDALLATARSLLSAPDLQRFFDPARYRRAMNEVEFALPDGRVGRIDRVVETEDEILGARLQERRTRCGTGRRLSAAARGLPLGPRRRHSRQAGTLRVAVRQRRAGGGLTATARQTWSTCAKIRRRCQ